MAKIQIPDLPIADPITGAENLMIDQTRKTKRLPVALLPIGQAVAYKGAAEPGTDPGTPAGPQFFIATDAGTYTNFKDSTGTAITVADGEFAIISYDGTAWVKQVVNINLTSYLQKDSISLTRGKNIFDKTATTPGYINSSGTVLNNANYFTSPEISITGGQAYTISGVVPGGTTGAGVAKYLKWVDAGGAIIGALTAISSNPFVVTAPADAVTMQFTAVYTVTGTADNIQVEAGSSATSYEPYSGYVSAIAGNPIREIDTDEFALKDAVYPKTSLYTKSEVDNKVPTVSLNSGKNLANPANIIDGYVNTSVNSGLTASTTWKMIVKVPTSGGKTYTISGWGTSRSEIAFFSGSIPDIVTPPYNANLLSSGTAASQGISKSGGVATFTAPVGTTWMAMTVKNASESETLYSQLQIEEGSTATSYTPFGQGQQVLKINDKDLAAKYLSIGGESVLASDAINGGGGGDTASVQALKLTLDPDGGSATLENNLSGKKLKQLFKIFVAASQDDLDSGHFDWRGTYLDGTSVHTLVDEAAPYRVFGTTIGGGHGYAADRITASAHGKTNADVGSVWSDGTNQFVIVSIVDANNFDISCRTDNIRISGTTLTHVSGASHTSSVTASSVANVYFYLYSKNYQISAFVDGIQVAKEAKSYTANRSVTFVESYEIIDKNSAMEWLITQAGTSSKITQFDGTSAISVSISYQFDVEGGCTIYTDFLALQAISAFQDIMFVMSNGMPSGAKYYIPKSLAFTQDSVNYNFTTPQAPGTPANRLNFTPDKCLSTGIFCDRLVMLNAAGTIGFSIGYLPVRDASIATRRTNATRKALQISEAGKVYMSAIDGVKTSLTKGDYFSVVAYKKYFVPVAGRTDQYVIRANDADYLYADWHTTQAANRVPLPNDLAGRDYTIVEKSANATVMSKATGSIVASTDISSSNYAYIILQFNK